MYRAVIFLVMVALSAGVIQANVIWERDQDVVNYVPRPGFCPEGTQGTPIDCEDGCRADQDCLGGGKCCPTACGRTCKTAILTDPKADGGDIRG